MVTAYEYVGVSTSTRTTANIPNFSKTNLIPTYNGGTFNMLFRTPTPTEKINAGSPTINNGTWLHPDGSAVSSSYTAFKNICSTNGSAVLDHTDGYTYVFYGFKITSELYEKYYHYPVKYIYSGQTIKNAITVTNPRNSSETVNVDLYLDDVCKLSWQYETNVTTYKFNRNSTSYTYFWAKLEKMTSENCDTTSSKVVYEFNEGDFVILSSDWTFEEMTTNGEYVYGGSARWKYSHITFSEGYTTTAHLSHKGRTISLPLEAITPATYDTEFWYTSDAVPNLNTSWYWWTPADLSKTLIGYVTSYGLGVHYNTPSSSNTKDGIYYKCGPSEMAIARSGNSPSPEQMVDGNIYILAYRSSETSQWYDSGIRFKYVNPSYRNKRLICDGTTNSTGYTGCYYDL